MQKSCQLQNLLHAYNNNYENFIVYNGDSGVLQTIVNQKLSYQGNVEVIMCSQCCMNGAGAPPIGRFTMEVQFYWPLRSS